MKHLKSSIILIGLMTLIVVAWGSDVGTLNTFSSGTTISSAAVNANFAAIKTAVNSKLDQSNTPGFDVSLNNNPNSSSVVYLSTTTGTISNIASVTVTAPAAGFVLLNYAGYFAFTHTSASTNTYAEIGVDVNTSSTDFGYMFLGVGKDAALSAYSFPVASTALANVNQAGTYTYYLNGNFSANSSTDAGRFTNMQFSALYFPSRY